jgi:hypothetical protein
MSGELVRFSSVKDKKNDEKFGFQGHEYYFDDAKHDIDAEFAFYIVDPEDPMVFMMGVERDEITHSPEDALEYRHFVGHWLTVMMSRGQWSDLVSRDLVMRFCKETIPGTSFWQSKKDEILSGRKGQKAHVLFVVNISDKEGPLDVVYLFDPRPVLPADTVRTILNLEKKEEAPIVSP